MADFTPIYDLESLSEQQRQEYVKAVCKHIGVPDNLNLVMLTYLDDGEGPRRLVPYAKRGATEIVRANRGINIVGLTKELIGGSVVWTATGKDANGRQEMSSGSKYIQGLIGRELDDAIMTAQTRACRRMTLQFLGAGILDESEVNPTAPVVTLNPPVVVPPAPKLQVNTDPGQEVKPEHQSETPEQFSARMEQMRKDAIAQLNAKHKKEPEPILQTTINHEAGEISHTTAVEEPKKRRGRKPKTVSLGSTSVPSTDVVQPQPVTPPAQPVAPKEPDTAPQVKQAVDSAQAKAVAESTAPQLASVKKLTPEQLKPYRQRQFALLAKLEENGFVPKEGMGNLDKLRSYVNIMFPDVTNFTEMTTDHWDKYLTAIEKKIATDPKQAIKHIEETIGI